KICLAAAKTAELAYGLSGQRKFVDIAKKQYQRALRLGPRNYLVYYHFCQFYETHPGLDRDFSERLRLLERLVQLFPTNARYHYLLGNLYLQLAREEGGAYFQKGEQEFRKAMELNLVVPHIYGVLDSKSIPDQKIIELGLQKLYELRKK
ncbi:MAG: hypothetical protein D6785_10095, partial [Planctomycetota bacterium]